LSVFLFRTHLLCDCANLAWYELVSEVCLLLVTRNEPVKAVSLINDLKEIVDEFVIVDSSDPAYRNHLDSVLENLDHVHFFRLAPLGLAEAYRAYALSKVCSEWVLMLDSDERINERLKADLKKLIESDADALKILRVIRHDQFSTDPALIQTTGYKTRLFKKDKTQFFGRVHEQPTINGKVTKLSTDYKIIHYVNPNLYWNKARRYIKLEVLLGRWNYEKFVNGSFVKRASLLAYLRLTGKRLSDEVTSRDLFLIKRFGAKGLKKLTYKPDEYLKRKSLLINCLNESVKKITFDVWCDVQNFKGAIQYLDLNSQYTWEKLNEEYELQRLSPEDFFIYLLINRFLLRNPNYVTDYDAYEIIKEINRAADIVFPEAKNSAI